MKRLINKLLKTPIEVPVFVDSKMKDQGDKKETCITGKYNPATNRIAIASIDCDIQELYKWIHKCYGHKLLRVEGLDFEVKLSEDHQIN